MLATATSDFKIQSFAADIQQFIVVNPPLALQKRFDARMKAFNRCSLLLFHDTPLYNLRSILLNGLLSVNYYLWTAEQLGYSYGFAYKDWIREESWKESPYKYWGVLLGLEVAGEKSNGTVHTFRDIDSVMVRYMFLLTPLYNYSPPPERATLEPAMLAAFEKLRA
jgi:hypothetical protein